MGPTWVLSAPDVPHVGPMKLAIRVVFIAGLATTGMSFQYVTKYFIHWRFSLLDEIWGWIARYCNGRDSVRLKSPASRLFTESFIQTQIKENMKAPRHLPFAGNLPGTGEFPAQLASNAENVSIWWRHHGITVFILISVSVQQLKGFNVFLRVSDLINSILESYAHK